MGDVSVMARRLKDGHVQHGWSGNGGCYRTAGGRLQAWYNDPDLVEYLFGLGQLELIGKPGSEKGGFSWMTTHSMTGKPHYLGISENDIFRKIAFVDYAYFYDIDNKWYYIAPRNFKIKMPSQLVENHLDDRCYEFDFIQEIEQKILKYILGEYAIENLEFKNLLEEKGYSLTGIYDEFKDRDFILDRLCDKYKVFEEYFDDWIVVEANENCTEVLGFKVKKDTGKHVETCYW